MIVIVQLLCKSRLYGVRFSYDQTLSSNRLYIGSSPSPHASPGGLKIQLQNSFFRALRRAGASRSHSPRRGVPTCERSRTPGPFSFFLSFFLLSSTSGLVPFGRIPQEGTPGETRGVEHRTHIIFRLVSKLSVAGERVYFLVSASMMLRGVKASVSGWSGRGCSSWH